jgi:hypothetical protein
MSYAFTQDVPIDARVYEQIKAELGPTPPEGLIVHVALEREAGKLSYVDVWQTREHFIAFAKDRLHPAVGRTFKRLGIPMPQPEPARHDVIVHDVWPSRA